MANINNLIIFHEARQLVRDIGPITESLRFGDLGNQMRRAAISVVSNICEGAGMGSDRQFARYLKIARASVNELQGQLLVADDLGLISPKQDTIAKATLLGKRISCLIRKLHPNRDQRTHTT